MRLPSKRRTCTDPACGVHTWPRRLPPHMACELVTPTGGRVVAAVYRVWDDNGNRSAHMLVYDGGDWSGRLPLPSRPRKVHVAAVRRARRFVRTGVLS